MSEACPASPLGGGSRGGDGAAVARRKAVARGAADWLSLAAAPDVRDDGANHRCAWRRGGAALRGGACGLAARRHGADVCADGRLSFGAMAEADGGPAKLTASSDA